MPSTFEGMAKGIQDSEAQGFAERLRRALEGARVRPSPTLLAGEFNLRYWGKSITSHTARNWLIGKSIPTQDKLRVLADWLQLSPDALRYGAELPVKVKDLGDEPVALDLQEREMLKRYLSLPPEDRKTVREVVAAMVLASTVKAQR